MNRKIMTMTQDIVTYDRTVEFLKPNLSFETIDHIYIYIYIISKIIYYLNI